MDDKIKTLLLRLPQNLNNVYDHAGILHPYSLSIISSFLKQHHRNVTLFDAAVNNLKRKAIVEYVKELNPNILGITIISQHLPHTIDFLKDIKRLLPGITVVAGGPHVTGDYENLMHKNKEIDIAVIGEGEYTMLEIIECIENGKSLDNVKGLSYMIDDEVRINQFREYITDLDSLPFADWESLPMEKYSDAITVKKNYGGIVASRGCPFKCTFCGAKTVLGKKVRRRSPENIIEEIKLLYDKYNVRQVLFHDSTLNIDNQWVNEICECILKMGRPIIWGCNLRTERLDKETLKLMKKSGCIRVFIGVESADNNILKRMKKGTTVEKVEKGIHMIEKAGIPTDYGFILGMPGETKESMKKSIAFAKKLKGISTFALASPFPGTELHEVAKQEGFMVDDWSKHDIYTLAYVPKGLTRNQLEHYYKVAVIGTYLRLPFLISQIFQLKSWLNLKITLVAAYRIFFKRLFKFKQ
jgi:radical SAM superfamily enzyme YgiQ (UPF0313 family)